MTAKMDRLAQNLARLNLQIRHDMEQAEAKVAKVNGLVKELGTTGLLNDFVTLGRYRYKSYDPDDVNSDGSSCRVIVSAFLVPEGFGVCVWDSDEAYDLDRSPVGLKPEARMRFVPFAKCDPADKAFLLPEIEKLLDELMDVAHVAAARMENKPYLDLDEYFAKRKERSRSKRKKRSAAGN